MTSFDTLLSISSRLKDLSHQLSISKLSKDELEELETLSRKLYERAIVLNYKAKEEEVYRKTAEIKEEVAEKPTIHPASTSPSAEVPGEIQFDFTSGFEAEDKTSPQEKKAEESKEIPTPISEDISQKEPQNQEDESSLVYYNYFSKAYHQAAGDKLGTMKIKSLKDAIGLNDRLLFVGELFNGDSNFYNETIAVLDQLESSEVALRKLSEIAAKGNWDKDISAVADFAHFINRRYVD